MAAALRSWNAGPQRAFELLRRSILEGEYSPEERLDEGQIAERLGVSRTPIRRALTMLEGHAARRAAGRIALRNVYEERAFDIGALEEEIR